MELKNKLSTGLAIIKANLFNKEIPLAVNLSLTDRCNFNCKYCSAPKWNRKEMSQEQAFSLIDELAELGTQRIGFTGGEALLREDIEEIINYSKKKGVYTTLITNGFLLSEKIDEIKNLDLILPSFDGPEKIHDKLKKKGSYKKLMEGIKAANDYKIPMWTVTVLTKYNTNPESLDFILEKAKELGFYTYYQILIKGSLGISGEIDSLLPSKEQHNEVFKKLIEEKKNGAPIISSYQCLNFLYNWPDYNITRWGKNWPKGEKRLKCQAGRLFCSIDCNGNVYPCLYKVGESDVLNCFGVGFKKAFEESSKQVDENCWCHVNIEYNSLFSLNLNSVFNALSKIG